MNLWESLAVAFEGLLANKMRAILTMLGVIIGVGAVITMLAIGQGAKQMTMQRIEQMGTNVLMVMSGQSRTGAVRGGAGSSQTLTLEDAEAITEKCPSVLKVAPEARQNAQVKYRNQNTNTSIVGVTPDYQSVRNYSVQDGAFFTESDVRSSRAVAVIGQSTATNLFGSTSPIGKTIKIKSMQFKVVGILASKGSGGMGDQDDLIMVPIKTAMRRIIGTKYVRMISVQARSMDVMDQASDEISTLLRKRHRQAANAEDDFTVRSQAEFMEMAEQTSQVFTLLLAGIASVSLLVGGIGIMNIMLVSVTERTREIGVRMALGARRRDIMLQFLIESMVLSLLGGTVGVIFGVVSAWLVGYFSQWSVAVSPMSIIVSFVFAAVVGVFFGLYPARQASRLDPIDALRYE